MSLRNRLLSYIDHKGLTVQNFEKKVGLSNASVTKMGDGTRRSTLDKISNVYPDLNINWLMTGEGEMIKDNAPKLNISSEKALPFFDVDVTLGFDNLPNDQTTIPSYYMNIPAFANCDCAVPCYGRSMVPEINDGAIIAIKEISLDSILPGEAYLIITADYRTVKYIRTVRDNPNKWRLVPKNLEEFDEMEIDKNKVLKAFLVKGVITNKII